MKRIGPSASLRTTCLWPPWTAGNGDAVTSHERPPVVDNDCAWQSAGTVFPLHHDSAPVAVQFAAVSLALLTSRQETHPPGPFFFEDPHFAARAAVHSADSGTVGIEIVWLPAHGRSAPRPNPSSEPFRSCTTAPWMPAIAPPGSCQVVPLSGDKCKLVPPTCVSAGRAIMPESSRITVSTHMCLAAYSGMARLTAPQLLPESVLRRISTLPPPSVAPQHKLCQIIEDSYVNECDALMCYRTHSLPAERPRRTQGPGCRLHTALGSTCIYRVGHRKTLRLSTLRPRCRPEAVRWREQPRARILPTL